MRRAPSTALPVVLLVFAYAAAALLGFRLGFLRQSLPGDSLCAVTVALAGAGLCVLDARRAGRPIPLLAQWVVLVTWPISAPFCVVRSRGGRGLLLLALLGFLLVVAYLIAWVAGVVASGLAFAAPPRPAGAGAMP